MNNCDICFEGWIIDDGRLIVGVFIVNGYVYGVGNGYGVFKLDYWYVLEYFLEFVLIW